MSKNSKKSATVTETPAERLERLKREMEAAQNELKQIEQERIDKLAAQIDELPKTFGVPGFADVISLIKQREKGTLGSIETGATGNRTRTLLDDATWAKIIERVKVGGAGNQRSEIVKEFGIHPMTLQNRLKDAGLVNSRTPAAPATPAPVAAPATATV